MTRALLACGALGLLAGCSSSLEVYRQVPPSDVATMTAGGRMAPRAIVSGDSRRELSPDARVEKGNVVIPNAHGVFVYKLRQGDVIEVGGDDRITAVRSSDGMRTVFVPGSAFSPEGTDEVHGQLAQGDTKVPLHPGDRIEVSGVFEDGEQVPGGGHVETTRSTFALLAGGFMWLIAYAPAFYVGVTSGHKGDRALVAPLLGPWLDLATRGKCEPPAGLPADLPVDPCSEETANRVALVASGAAQALGGILVAIGLPSHTELVDDPAPHHTATQAKVRWQLVPRATRSSGGLFVLGTF